MTPRYAYECSNGDYMESRQPVEHCLAYHHGKPCQGTLKPVRPPAYSRH